MDFSTLQSKVADWLNRTDLTTQIPDFINIALHELERGPLNWKYMEVRQQTVTSSAFITMPTSFKDVKWLKVSTDSGYKALKRDSTNQLLAEYPYLTDNTGEPEKFGVMGNQTELLIRPTPDASYTFDGVFYIYSADLSGNSDTNWWLTNRWEVLLYGALLSASGFLGDDGRIPIWQGMYDKAIHSVQNAEAQENLGGSGPSSKSIYVV